MLPETTLSLSAMFTLFGVMALLAAVPGASVLLVVARSSGGGLWHGAAVTAGIMLGDAILIGLALSGMSALSTLHEGFQRWLFVLGGSYLIWLGWRMWRVSPQPTALVAAPGMSYSASIGAGLILTLADLKAVLFYLALLPAFIDVDGVTSTDAVIVLLTAMLAIGTAKMTYALAIIRLGQSPHIVRSQMLQRVGAALMLVVGINVLLVWH